MTKPHKLVREVLDSLERWVFYYIEIISDLGAPVKDVGAGRFAYDKGKELVFIDKSHLRCEILVRHETQLSAEEKNLLGIFLIDHRRQVYCIKYSFSYFNRFEAELFRFDYHPRKMGDYDLAREPIYHLQVYERAEPRFRTDAITLDYVLDMIEATYFPDQRRKRLSRE